MSFRRELDDIVERYVAFARSPDERPGPREHSRSGVVYEAFGEGLERDWRVVYLISQGLNDAQGCKRFPRTIVSTMSPTAQEVSYVSERRDLAIWVWKVILVMRWVGSSNVQHCLARSFVTP